MEWFFVPSDRCNEGRGFSAAKAKASTAKEECYVWWRLFLQTPTSHPPNAEKCTSSLFERLCISSLMPYLPGPSCVDRVAPWKQEMTSRFGAWGFGTRLSQLANLCGKAQYRVRLRSVNDLPISDSPGQKAPRLHPQRCPKFTKYAKCADLSKRHEHCELLRQTREYRENARCSVHT